VSTPGNRPDCACCCERENSLLSTSRPLRAMQRAMKVGLKRAQKWVPALAMLCGVLAGVVSTPLILWRVASIRGPGTNGWSYSLSLGRYGWNIFLRAIVAHAGLGANTAEEAVYFHTSVDRDGALLDGSRSYRMHFAPGQLPPVRAFWSLTLVRRSDRYFAANPIQRYSIGDRTQGVRLQSDGSLDLYIRHDPPLGMESNWLPAPSEGFLLVLRAYEPERAILEGAWQIPPLVQEVTAP
jgi:hypothetical protein